MPESMLKLTSDPLEVLAAHNHWGTRRVIELCRPLTREQFHRSFPIGPGSSGGLHAALTHILTAMRRWEDWLRSVPLRPSLERVGRPTPSDPTDARDRTPDELLAILDESTRALLSLARDARLHEHVIVHFGPRSYTFSRGAAFAHAFTHGHYHRAQCINMLRHLGVPGISDALPELDVVDWQYEEEGGAAPVQPS